MRITNKFKLPQTLVNIAERDQYSRGACHISVTQLIDSPRIKVLKEKHADDIVVDVADSLWSLVGRALHHIAEAGADDQHIAEERLFTTVLGWDLSGGIDLQRLDHGRVGIRDYKFTSVWAATQDKPEWERQLNVYSYLARVTKGWVTEDLQITALLRDWNRRDAARDRAYPQAPIMTVPVELWSLDEQQAYVETRIKLHQDAWRAEEWGDELPECTPEERWAKPDKWAAMKPGAKRASAVFDSLKEAMDYQDTKPQMDYIIDHRPGESTRCLAYCDAAPWCDFSQALAGPLEDL